MAIPTGRLTSTTPSWTSRGGLAVSFRRLDSPPLLASDDLTAALVGIGFNLAGTPAKDPDIEPTLIAASLEAMERPDLRVLDLLVTWFAIHAERINVGRLRRLLVGQPARVRALWSAFARLRKTDGRFAKLTGIYRGPRVDAAPGTEFLVQRDGEHPDFTGTPLRVARKLLRGRRQDVLTPEQLAQRHAAYRCRVILGPCYRADCWAVLEARPDAAPADVARVAGASFSTAWHAHRDFVLIAGGGPVRPESLAP